jgi:cytochrome c-type biogenesis protein CcmH
MLYALFALLSALVAAVLAVPLLRRRGDLANRADYDVALYRAQLAELQAEQDSGAIGPAEAAAARTEIERRLLRAADRTGHAGPAAVSPGGRSAIALAMAGFIAVLGGLIYHKLGNPDLPDQPAVREADVPADQATPEELAVRLAATMAARPDELRGWLMLGPLASSVGRFDLAAQAYAGAARLEPGNVAHWLALGQAYTARDAGMVNAEARDAFGKALVLSPRDPMARYYLGLADFQNHADRAAFDRWAALADDTPPGAEWSGILARGLMRVSRRLGLPAPEFVAANEMPAAPPAASPPGPTTADVQAAGEMSESDRGAMIAGMVQRLADRLKENPDDLDGWLRLGRACTVLGRKGQAMDAYNQALRLDPANETAKQALIALKAQ